MNKFYIKLLLLLGMEFLSVPLYSQIFEYNGLTYNVIGNGEVELTKVPDNLTHIVVPSIVYYNDSPESGSGSRSIIEYTVTSLGNYVFSDNHTMSSIVLPSTLVTINIGAFHNASSLKEISIPEGVTSLFSDTFSGCKSLEKVTLPDNLTNMAYSAFRNCSSLSSITLPHNLTELGSSVFEGCSSLASITLPNSLTELGSSVFEGCSSLTSITLPDGISVLHSYLFAGCKKLKNIKLPENLEIIELAAFEDCESLQTIAIPKKVKEMDYSAFYGCTSLEQFYVEQNNPYYSSVEGMLCNKAGNALVIYPEGKGDENILVPSFIKEISDGAFAGQNLKSVTLLEGLEYIGHFAFGGCEKLTTIKFPASLKEIGVEAFDYCTSLRSVSFPLNSKLKVIREEGFENCYNLSYVDLPASIETIEGDIFEDAFALRTLICRAKTPPSLSDNIFSLDENWTKTQLCVPFGCVDKYSNTYPWSKFTNITEIEEKVKVSLNVISATLMIGNTLNLEAKVTGSSTSGVVIWSSENPEIATVDDNGLVEALTEGKTKIYATYGKVSASCALTVEKEGGESKKMRIKQSVINLYKGSSLQLSISFISKNPEFQTIKWTSENPEIASVSNTGVVYGRNYGSTFIKASSEGLSATSVVNVIEEPADGNSNGSDAGVDEIPVDLESPISIYQLNGVLIKKDCKTEELKSLDKGIYIVVSGNERFKISI